MGSPCEIARSSGMDSAQNRGAHLFGKSAKKKVFLERCLLSIRKRCLLSKHNGCLPSRNSTGRRPRHKRCPPSRGALPMMQKEHVYMIAVFITTIIIVTCIVICSFMLRLLSLFFELPISYWRFNLLFNLYKNPNPYLIPFLFSSISSLTAKDL